MFGIGWKGWKIFLRRTSMGCGVGWGVVGGFGWGGVGGGGLLAERLAWD